MLRRALALTNIGFKLKRSSSKRALAMSASQQADILHQKNDIILGRRCQDMKRHISRGQGEAFGCVGALPCRHKKKNKATAKNAIEICLYIHAE
jgi:hypothetical protein